MDSDSRRVFRVFLSFFTGYALACPLVALVSATLACQRGHAVMWLLLVVLSLLLGVLLLLLDRAQPEKKWLSIIFLADFLVLLPAWGFGIDWSLQVCESCRAEPSQALRTPDIIGLYVLYAGSVMAFVVSRRRPRLLNPATEIRVMVFLLVGVLCCAALCLQFGVGIWMGLIYGPIGLPLVAPPVVGIVFSAELIARLRRRSPDRRAPGFLPVVFWSAPLLCLWSWLQLLVFGAYPWEMFTQTCEWTFSVLQPAPADCHYLCTVAARGSPWLVRPRRVGRRHGQAILVNRQLCVANAFEDLLHTRWPRLGRFCRRTYDRLGLPVSRLLRRRFLADVTYLLMKPAEWLFALSLLLLDGEDPERRIDRMYR